MAEVIPLVNKPHLSGVNESFVSSQHSTSGPRMSDASRLQNGEDLYAEATTENRVKTHITGGQSTPNFFIRSLNQIYRRLLNKNYYSYEQIPSQFDSNESLNYADLQKSLGSDIDKNRRSSCLHCFT